MPDRTYFNRELSWLEFNQRVLNQAADERVPLLERVKFLAITGSNLDEFFKVRVGGLRLALQSQQQSVDVTGLSIADQLEAVTRRARQLVKAQSEILRQMTPELNEHGIKNLAHNELTSAQMEKLKTIFDREILSAVSPIAIDAGQPFPSMVNANLAICVRVKFDAGHSLAAIIDDDVPLERFIVIGIGPAVRRIINLPKQTGYGFLFVEDLISIFLNEIFPGQEILESCAFRLTRNADIALNEDEMGDLLKEMTQLLEARKVSQIVRLEVGEDVSDDMLNFLQVATSATDDMVFRSSAPLDLTGLFELSSISGFGSLKDPPWPGQPSPEFMDSSQSIFEVIDAGDRVLFHPYQRFDPVIKFLQAAAEDPDVIAIKQTLYRTSRDSEMLNALVEAASNGKQVSAIVELKARFDEARNIFGARRLEQAGVDVIYGVQGLKTHAKLCIVVRKEPRGIQRYLHFGTGNYNESTAKLYSDVSYFTNNEQLGSDAVMFFNAITGLSVPQPLQSLAAAPIDLKETLLDLIQVEIECASNGVGGAINAKLNSLADKQVIDALYDASQAGVKIRLNIRGICCLKPGVPGLSENIEVFSIVDRLLEHARIIHFGQGGDDQVYISSADWMGRNLNRRAELLVPIEDRECRDRILSMLEAYFKDRHSASKLNANGDYEYLKESSTDAFRAQEFLYQQACDAYTAFTNPKATVFEALRGESA